MGEVSIKRISGRVYVVANGTWTPNDTGASSIDLFHNQSANTYRVIGQDLQTKAWSLNCMIEPSTSCTIVKDLFIQFVSNGTGVGIRCVNTSDAKDFEKTISEVASTLKPSTPRSPRKPLLIGTKSLLNIAVVERTPRNNNEDNDDDDNGNYGDYTGNDEKDIFSIPKQSLPLVTQLCLDGLACSNPKQSMKYFEEAIRTDSKYAFSKFCKASTLYRLGDYEKSLKYFREALKLDSKYPEGWHNKGLVLFKLGRDKEALDAFTSALQLKPDHPVFKRNFKVIQFKMTLIDDAPIHLKCPITKELMRDPVMAPSGYTYEKSTILAHLEQSNTDPLAEEPLFAEELRPNRAIKNAIDEFLVVLQDELMKYKKELV